MQLSDLVALALDNKGLLGGSTGALLASFIHARLDASPRAQRALSLVLPPLLNTKVAKAVAVDLARAVIASWDTPASKPSALDETLTEAASKFLSTPAK